MKRKLISLAIAIAAICLLASYGLSSNTDSSFSLPADCRAIAVYSSGVDEKEQSILYYIDAEGNIIGSSRFDSACCRNAVLYDRNSNEYNFFTHEKIYFSNGAVVENSEMEDTYSFASEDGHDEVYSSGYIDSWDVFYKQIPHGLAYDISEMGYFDIITLYDSSSVQNLRVLECGKCASDKSGNLYIVAEDNDNESIRFNKITKGNSGYSISDGSIDISECGIMNDSFTISHIFLDDKGMYLLAKVGEGEEKTEYMLKFEKKEDTFSYRDTRALDLSLSIPSDVLALQDDDEIRFYIYYLMSEHPGMLTYDKGKCEFSFEEYSFSGIDNDDIELSVERRINDDIYMLLQDSAGYHHILKDSQEILKYKAPDNKLFLVDFIVI